MRSRKEYNLVQNDNDLRIPLVPDEAFQNGINFNVKLIGAMDIPRPVTRVEIVAAMRRVRFEFKAKGIKKRKVSITVSTEGLRTFVRKKKPRNKKNHVNLTSPEIIIESHPIYRIFYVSHDSQDVKIFSYIARETSSSVFRCCVFKAAKKSQAMKIVRTVGQAFEVCHKISGPIEDDERVESSKENQNHISEEIIPTKKSLEMTPKPTPKKIPPPINVEPEEDRVKQSPDIKKSIIEKDMMRHESSSPQSPNKELSNIHETKLLREKLEQATQSWKAAQAQVNLLRDQISAEANARIEAQSRTHQLLQQNRELLDHLQSLVRHIQELEGTKQPSLSSVSPTPLPQFYGVPRELDINEKTLQSIAAQNAALLETILYENNRHYPYCLYHMHPGTPGHIPPAHSLNQLLVNPLLHHSVPPSSQSSSPTSKFYEDSLATVFTSAGHPCDIIKPIDTDEGSRGVLNREGMIKFGGNVQRSVSEKIGHRSDLMSQVQRATWSRHTTQ